MGPGHYEAIITRIASKENLWRLAILTMAMCIACKESCVPMLGLVDFTIGIVNSVLNLLNRQVKFFMDFKLHNCNN